MLALFMLRTLLRSPRRLLVGITGIAIPVALFASMAYFVDTSARSMTAHSIAPVQIDLQVLVNTPNPDLATIGSGITRIRGISKVEEFATADVGILLPGATVPQPVKLFAVGPGYLAAHPWVKLTGGTFATGAVFASTFANGSLPAIGGVAHIVVAQAAAIAVPVTGSIDLRQADTWFATTSGDNQGNILYAPNSVVIDYATFSSQILPALRSGAQAPTTGSSSAAPVAYGLQYHVTIDRSLLATDPTLALVTSTGLRRTIERSAPGQITAIDNLGDSLSGAAKDSINAKVLILFIGLPGVLVGGWLAIISASFLAESRRRDLALMNMRGLSPRQAAGINVTQALFTSVVGGVVGLGLGAGLVTIVLGSTVWSGVSSAGLIVSSLAGIVVGLGVTGISLVQFLRNSSRTDVIAQRRQIDITWNPKWRQRYFDLWAIGVGLLILAINFFSGGFKPTASEGQTLSLSFYLLLAPIALWIGVVLLGMRLLTFILARSSYPSPHPETGSWTRIVFRWMGRRPGKTVLAAIIGSLAIAFGVSLLTFIQTYDATKYSESVASIGADINLTPPQSATVLSPPTLDTTIVDVAGVYTQSLGIGTEKRSAYIVDPSSYQAAINRLPDMTNGGDAALVLKQLAKDTQGTIISRTFATDFNILSGDTIRVTYASKGVQKDLSLHIIGIYDTVVPTTPKVDLLLSRSAFPADALPVNPDFYLIRVAPGLSADTIAAQLTAPNNQRSGWAATTVGTAAAKEQNSLSTLNLSGLGRIETIGVLLISALGIAMFGAFIILERRKEYAVIRAIGATRRQVLSAPAIEGLLAVIVSIIIGVPLGLAMTVISVRVLTPLFALAPPIIAIDPVALVAFVVLVVVSSLVSLAVSLVVVSRLRTSEVLRET